jgi:prepilin signal peptidase PulO-like enzyme (type II secretory pathway)
LFVVLLVAVGHLAGVGVNFLADYLPARRHYHLARSSPFATAAAARPRLPAGREWLAWLSGLYISSAPPRGRVRRVIVHVSMVVGCVLIGLIYQTAPFLPFFLYYTVVFALITVIDIEHRWILAEVVGAGLAGGLVEGLSGARLRLDAMLGGAVIGFAILFAFYAAGFVFGALLRALAGRAVGRTVFGFGDVLAGVLCGFVLGGEIMGTAALLTMLLGGVGALIVIAGRRISRMRAGRRRGPRHAALPYGPYIVLGAAIMLYVPTAGIEFLRWIIGLA